MIEIKHRFTGAVLFKSESATTIKEALLAGIAAGANLADANLADANLAGANLADANLARADLAGAYLARAYLARAYLARAYLAGARNVPAGVTATDPVEPYQRPAIQHDYASRARRYREHHPNVPVVESLDQKILDRIGTGECSLDMATWHACETTHCRAGWAIHLAGDAGYALEKQYGSERAGAMIYRASTGRSPWFFDTTERALEDIKRCASEASAAPAGVGV